MSPSDFYLRHQFGTADSQENIDYDGNGNEIYHGWASNVVATSDPGWVIIKNVYTSQGAVFLLTHASFLRGQIWDNRAAIVFP